MKIEECAGSVSGAGDDRLLEQHAFAREAIEIRRLDAVEAVGVDAIGARRVERDEQQVEIGGTARQRANDRAARR